MIEPHITGAQPISSKNFLKAFENLYEQRLSRKRLNVYKFPVTLATTVNR